MREPNGYRQTVEWLTDRADGKGWLSVAEISRILGIDRKTVKSKFGVSGNGCATPVLAMRMAQESEVR